MKVSLRPIIVKISVIVMILGIIPVVAVAAQPSPKAVAAAESYDFGTVLEGNDVIHEFVVKNTGDAPLDIQNVRTG